jgi:phosphatidylglycerol:prolipoprotein diacylglycerol transferase
VYSRIKRVPWPALGDMLVVPAPIGIFFGRIANFINGELWGHEAPGLRWAVQFPAEVADRGGHPGLHADVVGHLRNVAPERFDEAPDRLTRLIIERLRTGDDWLRERLSAGLPARHPSQLYEALLEGALLFAVLCFVRLRWKNLPHGVLTGLFFIGYAALRIIAEQWRVPDATGLEALSGILTPGQQYSLPMVIIGGAFLWNAWRRRPAATT